VIARNTPARPWTAWLGRGLCGDSRPSKDQSQIARGVGLSGRRQAEHQMEAEAS
jgi:hypothetical protein